MIELIFKTIEMRLQEAFSLKVYSEDVEGSVIRPSFVLSIDAPSTVQSSRDVKTHSGTIRISYLPSKRDNCSIELYQMIERLNDLFLFPVDLVETIFEPKEKHSEIVNKIAEFQMDYSIRESIPETETEFMEELKFEIEEGNNEVTIDISYL